MFEKIGQRLFPRLTPVEQRLKTKAIALAILGLIALVAGVALLTMWTSGGLPGQLHSTASWPVHR